MNLANITRKLFNALGYDLQPLSRDFRKIRTNLKESYMLISNLGFQPRTIIDVGVASGTPELYQAFPNSYFLLIEPLKEFETDLINILKRYRGSYVLAAAGSCSGTTTFNVHDNHPNGSSLFKESMGPEADGHEVVITTVRMDDIIMDRDLKGPYLIKVDAQGAELAVLEGAPLTLSEAEVVVLEVSMFEFMKGAPQFHKVASYMNHHGFAAYDIIPGWNRPLDGALGQIDMVFVKEKGMFRRDHSYSTVSQMKAMFG